MFKVIVMIDGIEICNVVFPVLEHVERYITLLSTTMPAATICVVAA